MLGRTACFVSLTIETAGLLQAGGGWCDSLGRQRIHSVQSTKYSSL